jgi:hypothetical protein
MTKYKVILPIELKPSPALYEITAAQLLANYFNTDVEFVPRSNYKSPDFIINSVKWELKSPMGKGRNNIERQLQTGLKQSKNIVFDARRSKIHISKIRNELNRQFKLTKSMKLLVLIEKQQKCD